MIGIYKIENRINGKIYIGKSKNIKKRFIQHKYYLTKGLNPKTYNRYLKNSVEKHGIENFCFSVLETFEEIDEYLLAEAEIKSLDYIKTFDSVEDIILENPSYKWQNIYSVCNGYKKSYMGYIWKKELKI